MHSTIQRFVHTDDLTAENGRRLLEWCVARGGDEFTIRFMGLGDTPGLHEKLKGALAPFHLGSAKREHSTTLAGDEPRRLAENWRLCPDSIALLHHHLAEGLFT